MCLACAGPARAWTPNAQEIDIANRMKQADGQHRAFLAIDPILSQVARERAIDMAKRKYFDHINPDGHGANYLVRKAGYVLPSSFPADGNNLESIAAGQPDAATAWSDWMGSPDHKRHLLAEIAFFAAQTSYGVGYYEDPGSPYRYYWVVITAPPMPAPATLTIVSPAEGAGVPEGAVAAAGTTGGAQPAAFVQISVENANGPSAWRTVSGTANWGAWLSEVAPGANTLHVRSLDSSAAVLASATRAFQYVVLRPLTVHVEGSGSVGAFAGTTSRRAGVSYTIVATPAAGWLFAGWSGSWSGANATTAFTMRAGFDATATFVPNPFLEKRGAYSGLVGGTDARGLIRLRLDALGQFSSGLTFGENGYAVLGRFGLDGNARVTVRRTGASPLTLAIHLDDSGTISGSLSDGTDTLDLTLAPALRSGPTLAALAGRYTFAFLADRANDEPNIPKGDGYGVLLVDPNGAVQLIGALADGATFTRGGWIEEDGRLAFYAPLYDGGGAMSGVLTFSDAAQSDLAGTLRWKKPVTAGARYFPRPFDTTITTTGSRYTPPAAGQPALTVPVGNPNAQLLLGDGNLSGEIAQPALIRSANLVTLATPALPGLAMTINAPNGGFSGTFTHPASGAVTRFRGVILRKQNSAAGFFLGVDRSGHATLAPAQ